MNEEVRPLDYAAPVQRRARALTIIALAITLGAYVALIVGCLLLKTWPRWSDNRDLLLNLPSLISVALWMIGITAALIALMRGFRGRWEIAAIVMVIAYVPVAGLINWLWTP